PIELKSTAIDMLSLSAHKLHGPKGIGALYVRRGVRFSSMIKGGHQERDRRAGTENTPGIVGLGMAAELALKFMDETKRIKWLRDRLENGIIQRIPNTSINGDPQERLPNTANIGFEGIEGDA
ncbi:MAG: aminotransferase class V-fold PLP-dependent enzyme, partial [Mesorhizobium sp.]